MCGPRIRAPRPEVTPHKNRFAGTGAIWGWFLTAVFAEMAFASMHFFRTFWNDVGLHVVSTPTGLTVLATVATCLLFATIGVSLHRFDLAYQRYEQMPETSGANPSIS